MSTRVEILNAVKELLEDTNLFYKVYTEITDLEKERSFPVAWINLGGEMITDGDISTTCYMRDIDLDITIGTKHKSTDQNMNELLDEIFRLMKDEYTLKGTAINTSPVGITTDRGYFHPYSLATILFKVKTR